MISKSSKARAAIAEQASERFAANDANGPNPNESAAIGAWLRSSQAHVEEFLGVATIARALSQFRIDPEYSVANLLQRARAEDERSIQRLWSRAWAGICEVPPRRWQAAAVACMAVALA